MCILDSCVYQIGGLCFLFIRVMPGRLEVIIIIIIINNFNIHFPYFTAV